MRNPGGVDFRFVHLGAEHVRLHRQHAVPDAAVQHRRRRMRAQRPAATSKGRKCSRVGCARCGMRRLLERGSRRSASPSSTACRTQSVNSRAYAASPSSLVRNSYRLCVRLPEPTISTPSSRQGGQRAAQRMCWPHRGRRAGTPAPPARRRPGTGAGAAPTRRGPGRASGPATPARPARRSTCSGARRAAGAPGAGYRIV